MALTIPKNEGGNFELCPEGNHVACCYAIIDLGTHEESYEGQPPKPKRKIFIQWEIPDELRTDGTPFRIGKTYTLSSNEKATMRKDLESWRGAKFSEDDLGNFRLKNLIEKACMLNVVPSERDGKTYANIASIARMPKGVPAPKLSEHHLFFSLDDDEFNADMLERVGPRLREQIEASPEYQNVMSNLAAVNNGSSKEAMIDIPF